MSALGAAEKPRSLTCDFEGLSAISPFATLPRKTSEPIQEDGSTKRVFNILALHNRFHGLVKEQCHGKRVPEIYIVETIPEFVTAIRSIKVFD
jgi:hypothetical protein